MFRDPDYDPERYRSRDILGFYVIVGSVFAIAIMLLLVFALNPPIAHPYQ